MSIETAILIAVTASNAITTVMAWKHRRETKEVTTDADLVALKTRLDALSMDVVTTEDSLAALETWKAVTEEQLKHLNIDVGRAHRRIEEHEKHYHRTHTHGPQGG